MEGPGIYNAGLNFDVAIDRPQGRPIRIGFMVYPDGVSGTDGAIVLGFMFSR